MIGLIVVVSEAPILPVEFVNPWSRFRFCRLDISSLFSDNTLLKLFAIGTFENKLAIILKLHTYYKIILSIE